MDTTAKVRIDRTHPDTYQALVQLSAVAERAARASGLDALLVELVKIRVSAINGCAFCLRMHTRDALAAGESTDRLAVLPAWRETTYFSGAEREALAVAEEVTRLTGAAPELREHLDDAQVAAVTWLATVMNAWNRVAISSGYDVGP